MTLLIWPRGTMDKFDTREDAARDFERLYPNAYYTLVGVNRLAPFNVRACYGDREKSFDREPTALMVEIPPDKE